MGRTQLTVTVSPDLGRYVEEQSVQLGVKKSEVVGRALAADRQRQLEMLMREGYEEMAEQDRELLEEFKDVDREVPWPEYSE